MELDGRKMPVLTLSGSEASDNDRPLDRSEEHETIKEYSATVNGADSENLECYGLG